MKRKIALWVTGIVILSVVIYAIWWTTMYIIYMQPEKLTHRTDNAVLSEGAEEYKAYQKQYQKDIQAWKEDGYNKGQEDFRLYGEKRELIYPEKLMEDLPEDGAEGNTKLLYYQAYERGFQDAQQKEKDKK